MTTIYTVEIITHNGQAWYKNKVGQKFEAQLSTKFYQQDIIGAKPTFKVDSMRSIDPNHCRVISEIKIKNN